MGSVERREMERESAPWLSLVKAPLAPLLRACGNALGINLSLHFFAAQVNNTAIACFFGSRLHT